MINALCSGKVDVLFEKKNGEKRVIFGTLNEEIIESYLGPVEESEKTKAAAERKRPEGVINIFDLDLKDWRSYRVDSVIDFNPWPK